MSNNMGQAGLAETRHFDDLLNKKYLGKKDYIWFSLTMFASSAITGMLQGYLLFFYTAIMNIPLGAVGTMFLIAKIWDGVNDPIMGAIVDKTRTKMGKMRPYLLWGSIPYALLTILLFINWRGMSEGGKIAYMYITYILITTVGTIVAVPLGGLPTVVSPNVDERTKMISISRILGSIGEQSALVLISLGLIVTDSNYELTYTGTAVIIGVIAPIFMVISALTLRERIEPTSETPKLREGFAYLFKNKPFFILILSNLLTFFRNLVSASIIYVVCYIYNNGSLQIAFALPGAIASMLGMLFAPKLKRMFNAKQLFIIATIWHSVCLAIVFAMGMNTPWYVVAGVMFVTMLPVGVLNVVPHLLLGAQDRSAAGGYYLRPYGTEKQYFERIERLFPYVPALLLPFQSASRIYRRTRARPVRIYETGVIRYLYDNPRRAQPRKHFTDDILQPDGREDT